MDLIFEDPPSPRAREATGEFQELADALREHPESWVVIKHFTQPDHMNRAPASVASIYANQARRSKPLRHGYEVVARQGKVYVRFVGTE